LSAKKLFSFPACQQLAVLLLFLAALNSFGHVRLSDSTFLGWNYNWKTDKSN